MTLTLSITLESSPEDPTQVYVILEDLSGRSQARLPADTLMSALQGQVNNKLLIMTAHLTNYNKQQQKRNKT